MNSPLSPTSAGSVSAPPAGTSQGKVVVITGATGVLGSRTAHSFAMRGHSLVLLGRDQKKLDSLVRDLNLSAERLYTAVIDLRDGQAVRAMAEAVSARFGAVHALIHLVGGWIGGKSLTEASTQDLESMLGQHVWTTFHLFQSFAPQLARSKWGRVMIVSPSTVSNPPANRGPYTAAKAAQENLVLTLSAELKDKGVTANIIQVYAIDEKHTGKGTTPEEIVAAMLYLFSDEAGKINGARIPVY